METNKLCLLTLNVFTNKRKEANRSCKTHYACSFKKSNHNNNNQPKNILQVIKVQNAVQKFTPQKFAFLPATPNGNRQMFPTVFP